MERLQRMFAGAGGALGHPPPDSPTLDSSEQVYISSLALLKMLKHGTSLPPRLPLALSLLIYTILDPNWGLGFSLSLQFWFILWFLLLIRVLLFALCSTYSLNILPGLNSKP